MANIKKISKQFVGHFFKHVNRTADDGVHHSNETIDKELTPENYYFKKGNPGKIYKVIEENGYYYMNRENSNPLIDVVVTLPMNVKEDDEVDFFESVYKFYCNDFGEKNVINAVVHKDEVTPHIHIAIIPVRELDFDRMSDNFKHLVEQEERRMGKPIKYGVSAKAVIDRNYLKQMHPRLSEWVEHDLGYRTEILNGKTAGGNRTIQELKNAFYERETQKAKAVMEQTRQQAELMEKNVQIVVDKTNDLGLDKRYFDAIALLEEQRRLMLERDIYRKALLENGITNVKIPQEAKAYLNRTAKQNGRFTYRNGIIQPKSGTVTVLETYIREPRVLPQQYLLEEFPQLKRSFDMFKYREVKLLEADHNAFLMFPTDDIERTFHNLLKLKEKEKEIKKLNMPKISNDTFNIAEAILRQCSFDTDYYYMEQNYLEDLQRDMELGYEMDQNDADISEEDE